MRDYGLCGHHESLYRVRELHSKLVNTSKKWRSTYSEALIIVLVGLGLAWKSYRVVNDDTRIVLEGELSLASVQAIKTALVENKGRFNTLQLVDSPGAGAAAGIIVDQIEELINRNNLITEVRGHCASACAAVFLLGNTRNLLASDDDKPSYLMVHAVRNHFTREVNYGKTEAINKKIAAKSLGKFPLKLLNRIFDDKKGTGDGEIFIFREPQASKLGNQYVFVCEGPHIKVTAECEPVAGWTPAKLGIRVVK